MSMNKDGGIMKIKNNENNLELTIEIPKLSSEYLKKLEQEKEKKLELTIRIPKLKIEKIDINELKSKLIKMNNKKRRKKYILTSIMICLILFSFIYLFKIYNNLDSKKKIEKNTQIIHNIVEVEETEFVESININPPEEKDNPYWKFINISMLDVNLNLLKEENSDTIGWIVLNNTNVNYPVLKTTNNEFYLNHQFDKSRNEAGWIYMDYRNSNIFSDNLNSIIYGHSLLNDALFGTLHNALRKYWYSSEDNLVIKTLDEQNSYLWQIFSIYKIPTTDDYLQTKFLDNDHYLRFLNMLKSRSINDFNITLNENDKILTLQTCYDTNEKIVIHAKLIKLAKLI